MPSRVSRRVLRTVVIVVVAVGLVIVGRVTAGLGAERTDASGPGRTDGYDTGYLAGLQDGVVQGRQEGRALQESDAASTAARPSVREAFSSGYAAGANDVFAGYDGGWSLSTPYVVTLTTAASPITYRIGSRVPVQPGVNYFLCPGGRDLCQDTRR